MKKQKIQKSKWNASPVFQVVMLLILPIITQSCQTSGAETKNDFKEETNMEVAKVYITKEITAESLMRIYEALGREANGKRVAIKISTGEPGGNNYLKPALIKNLVQSVNGTIIECNTAYGGKRSSTANHLKTARDHGFTAIADVDIMDKDGEVRIPVVGGKHIAEDIIGKNFLHYDFTVILSHFKGHAMAGFGGAIKNMSIGIASANGKLWIHSGGKSTTGWGNPTQEEFLETMAEAAKAIADHCGDKIIYINIMNNLSIDCDCDSNPADPQMGDIGILASLDPVALDKACVDQVYASTDHGKIHLVKRMESKNGIHAIEYGERIGLGTQKYELISLDK